MPNSSKKKSKSNRNSAKDLKMDISDPGINFTNTPPVGQHTMAPSSNQNTASASAINQTSDNLYNSQYTYQYPQGYAAPYVTQTVNQPPQTYGAVNMNQYPTMSVNNTNNLDCVTTSPLNPVINTNYLNNANNNPSQHRIIINQQEPVQASMVRPATPPSYRDYQAQMQTQTLNQNPSLTSLLQSLDNRLGKIESQMNFQTQQMSHQNNRIQNIERHVEQITVLKHSVTQIENKLCLVDNDLTQIKSRQSEYEKSINTYSNMCDDILKSQVSANERISDLSNKVNNLLTPEIETMKINHHELKEDFLDTKTRQMCENLIFTGIDEAILNRGEVENCEATLRNHLAEKMGIFDDIQFDRVHRLGRYKRNSYPRPIIAKFHNFKIKEMVKQKAPDTLKNTKYGVREQCPEEYERRRKVLYPTMKSAKQD